MEFLAGLGQMAMSKFGGGGSKQQPEGLQYQPTAPGAQSAAKGINNLNPFRGILNMMGASR